MSVMNVGVFRKQYLPITETFIAEQGYGLPNGVKPVFIGLRQHKKGLHHVHRDDFLSLSTSSTDYSFGRAQMAINEKLSGAPSLPGRWVERAQQANIKVLHSHFGHTGLVGMQLAKKLDIPHIVTFHGHDIAPSDLDPGYVKKLPALWEHASCVIAVSEHIKNKLLERGAPEDKVRVHYIGINTDTFTADKSVLSPLPTVLFVGRLVAKKGIKDLIAAMQKVARVIPDAQLVVIGDGPEKEKLLAAKEQGLNIQILGARSPQEIQEQLNKSWVFCGPSCANSKGDMEGLGMVFLESQATTTPVISCLTGGIPEAVSDGNTAILVSPNDPESLGDALIKVLSDPKLRDKMGEAGREFVSAHFNVKTQCRELTGIYEKALAR